MTKENNEQLFMKKAVILAKDKNLTTDSVNELLDELKIGELEE